MDNKKGDSYSFASENGEANVVTYKETYADIVPGGLKGWIEGFKPQKLVPVDSRLTDIERANLVSANVPLMRSLKSRHLQMIAIGGSIGSGLFVASGSALNAGGPAALIIVWILTGIMMYCTIQALGELCVTFPVAGSFVQYNTRFFSPAWGFCMGWNYALQWLIVLPLELVGASMTIAYWDPNVNGAAWVTIFYALIIFINIFGVKGYGEAEFVFSFLKVLAIIGFIILGIVLNCGGGPIGEYIGGKYWNNPGAFANGFKGLCSVFISSAFSFSGTELIGLAAAETENPRLSLPSAIKQVFWRISLFYIISLIIVGLLVPYDDERLLGTSGSVDDASPFVIAIIRGGISGLPSVMNVVIMIAVCSVANSSVYGSSRTIASLADQGFAPRICGYIDREGRPLVAVGISLIFGALCYLVATPKQSTVFNWLLALSGLSSIFTWASICACHLRFRRALEVQGRNVNELTFVSQCGKIGSYIGLLLNCLIIAAQFWISLFPLGSPVSAESFFESFLCVPILIIFYLFWMFYKRDFTLYIKSKNIDIDSGRRYTDLELLTNEIAEEKAYFASRPWSYRLYKFWC
ncbi:bifunctional polyamine/amino acid permease [Martiniozyma asiatica (nom. inval.)]|nr:bifunctional polyamine/amino acid permease [Martiniozyma asiatica]